MFILNPDNLQKKVSFKQIVTKYLLSHEIPVLSHRDGSYYFSDTDELKQILNESPWYIKLFI